MTGTIASCDLAASWPRGLDDRKEDGAGAVTVDFLPFGDLNLTLLEASLRVEDLSLYLTSDDDGSPFSTALPPACTADDALGGFVGRAGGRRGGRVLCGARRANRQ